LENGFGVEQDIAKAVQLYDPWDWYHSNLRAIRRASVRCSYGRNEGFTNRPIRDLIVDFDEYIEVRELGKGEFGWSTMNEKNGELFCVKHYRVNREFFDRLSMVVILDIVLRPRHPCLLRYFGWELAKAGSEEWRVLSEYHPNGSLEDIFEEIRKKEGDADSLLPRELVSKIIICLVCAVRYLTYTWLRHGNLKPSNILFDKDHNPVIGDLCNDGFDQRRSLRLREEKNARYVSPRLEPMPFNEFGGHSVSSAECDIYSIGAIVREMMVVRGELEMCTEDCTEGKERKEGNAKHERGPYRIIGEIIEGCLKQKAAERPTAQQLEELLRSCDYCFYPEVPKEITSQYLSLICRI
jgi:serine/threonine protein kinase